LALYSDEIVGLDLREWLANPLNIALINDKGDVSLLEHQEHLTNTAIAHYFYFSRGKEAIKTGQQFLKEVFTEHYPETIIGLTPEKHKGALWLNRKLGLTEHGTVDTAIGPCRFVMITKQQWKDTKE
jgi:hypothetical protein